MHANLVFAVHLRDEDKKTTGAEEIQILINDSEGRCRPQARGAYPDRPAAG